MAPVLGALFAILIGVLAIRPYIIYQQRSFENIEAANTASQFRQLINAAQLYVQNNCLPTADGNTGEITPPSTCPVDQSLSGSNYYVVLVDKNLLSTLQSNGYLPQGTTATNPYQQGWSIVVSSVASSSGGGSSGGGSSSNNNIQALLYSTGGQNIPERLAPEIAAETGQEGGFVPYPNQYGSTASNNLAQGAYGHWSTSFPNTSPGEGHLVALLDVGQNGVDDDDSGDYLYRRQVPGDPQVNTMQADLNMGGTNGIVNATEVVAGSSQPGQTSGFNNNAVMTTASGYPDIEASSVSSVGSFVAHEAASPHEAAVILTSKLASDSSPGYSASAIMQANDETAGLGLIAETTASFSVSGGTSSTLDIGGSQSPNSNSLNSTSGTSTLNLTSAGTSSLNIQSTSKGTSSLNIQNTSNPATENLAFISTPESVGCPCNPGKSPPSGCSAPPTNTLIQLGTIAPNADTTGMPLVCTVPPQSGSLGFGVGTYGATNIILNPGSQTSQATWQLLGSQNFTALQYMALQPASLNGSPTTPGQGIYVNNTNKPLFISSSCPLNDGSGGEAGSGGGNSNEGTSINFYLSSNISALSQSYTATDWTTSGVSLSGGGVGMPSSSVIVPPGYAFGYSLYTDKTYGGQNTSLCSFTISY